MQVAAQHLPDGCVRSGQPFLGRDCLIIPTFKQVPQGVAEQTISDRGTHNDLGAMQEA